MKNYFSLCFIFISISLFSQNVPSYVPTNGLICFYLFSGNSDDSSGNNLNGMINGGVSLTFDRFGNPNSSYLFDGTTGYINVPSNNLLTLNNHYSISGWFYSTGSVNQETIMSQSINSTQGGLSLNLDNLLNYDLVCDNTDGTGTHQINSDTIPNLNTWYNCVETYDGTTLKIYVNGVLKNSISYSINLFYNLHILTIGSQNLSGTNDYFSGKLDDIGVWNRSLTLQEVQQLYTGGLNTCSVYDTIHISVTDTLIINTPLTGINPPNNINTLEIYPNPTSDHILINTGDYSTMTGYTIKIINPLSQVVFQNVVNQQLFNVSLSGWSHGTYLLEILDGSNTIIETKIIILQ